MFVVPTSRSVAPLTAITSGMRKLPPISTNCPRETITSLPAATARSAITVAAAQLFTAVALSAPVIAFNPAHVPLTARPRRLPVAKSSSREFQVPARGFIRGACGVFVEAGARPRLVCSTTPVALMTVRKAGAACASSRSESTSRCERFGADSERRAGGEFGAERIERGPRGGGNRGVRVPLACGNECGRVE